MRFESGQIRNHIPGHKKTKVNHATSTQNLYTCQLSTRRNEHIVQQKVIFSLSNFCQVVSWEFLDPRAP